MIKLIKKIVLKIDSFICAILSKLIKKRMLIRLLRKGNYKDFPIYIISFNRLSYVKQTVEWLKKYGYTNIIIIDNKSDYQPLLDYYGECNCHVIRMNKNYGHLVFKKHPKFFFVRNFCFYVLTDPDLTPVIECPSDFIEQFLKIFTMNVNYSKVGFSLKIDDLPDSYYLKDEVLVWESRFYKDLIDTEPVDLYNANIDTTFAVNSPDIFVSYIDRYKGVRVGFPYQVRHLPWYGEKPSEELDHYLKSVRKDVSNWNGNISKERMQKRMKKHM